MHEQQDEDIIELVLRGDRNAYAVLIERYQHFVFTLATNIIQNREDAEEVAQDVFVKAYNSLQQYNKNSKFSTWLYAICRNTCLSHLRKNKIETTPETPHISHDNVTKAVEQRSEKLILQEAIKQLKKEEATVIQLFYLHEQTIEEIAHILDLSESNIKVRLFRARKKLKSIIHNKYQNELTR